MKLAIPKQIEKAIPDYLWGKSYPTNSFWNVNKSAFMILLTTNQ